MIIPLRTSVSRRDRGESFMAEPFELTVPATAPTYSVELLGYDTEKRTYQRYGFHSMVDPAQPVGHEVGEIIFSQEPMPGEIVYLRELRDAINGLLGEEPEIDYANDWAGECRVDPVDGNGYVLCKVGFEVRYGYGVVVNDVMGGHTRTISIDEWLSWEKQPDA